MVKKTTKRAGAKKSGFSTAKITQAITKALGELRAERKARSAGWTVSQHLQAAACEMALVLAQKKCRCTSSSHSFPKSELTEATFLRGLGKE
jgi:hypothetical protein